jgi:hypothetical protein
MLPKPRVAFVNGLSDYRTMKSLRGRESQAITAFQLKFSRRHLFPQTASKILNTKLHPLERVVIERYMERDEPLWWSCVCRKEIGANSSVVRTFLARKVRNAFKESLRKMGYDAAGRRLEGSELKVDLYGTANIMPAAFGLRMKYGDLVKQTDIAVLAIVNEVGTVKPDRDKNLGRASSAAKAKGNKLS